MAVLDPTIPPFPPHIDRVAFGHFVSGFVAGEGCFLLQHSNGRVKAPDPRCVQYPSAIFAINIRADDRNVLELIRAYFQCGRLYYNKRSGQTSNDRPKVTYRVEDRRSVHNVIVPHFERFPLIAKKARDFEIWKEGVALIYRVTARRVAVRRDAYGRMRGSLHTWKDSEKVRFFELARKLRAVRKYVDPITGGDAPVVTVDLDIPCDNPQGFLPGFG